MGSKCKIFVFGTPKRHILARNDVIWRIYHENRCRGLGCRLKEEPKTRNSSGDEIANVNFVYDDIVHVQQNTIDSCTNSATDRRGHMWERMFYKSQLNFKIYSYEILWTKPQGSVSSSPKLYRRSPLLPPNCTRTSQSGNYVTIWCVQLLCQWLTRAITVGIPPSAIPRVSNNNSGP